MWDFLGGALGGLFGHKGAKDQNIASAQQAEKAMAFSRESQQKQMDFQERMSGSAHQRQMADMRKAGLNPILSAKYGGASSPAGSSAAGVAAPVQNKMERALNSAQQIANINQTIANTNWTDNKTGMTDLLGSVGKNIASAYNSAMSAASQQGKKTRAGAQEDFEGLKGWVQAHLPNANITSSKVYSKKIKYPEKFQGRR